MSKEEMNKSDNLPKIAPESSSAEGSPDFSYNQPPASQIGFENININRIGNPTLFPFQNFNSITDTETALSAINIKSDVILSKLLSQRTAIQRKVIADLYFQTKNETLVRDIKKSFRGFSRYPLLLIGLSVPYHEYIARNLHVSFNFNWINYILFTVPMHEIEDFKNYLFKKYNHVPAQYCVKKLSHDNIRLNFHPTIGVLENTRDESDIINEAEVQDDVGKIKLLIGGTFVGGIESELNILKEIFLTKNFKHIKQVCEHYHLNTGAPIKVILEALQVHNLFIHIAEYALNPPKYFAKVITEKVFGGRIHHEYLLTHTFIRRSEIDLHDIKMEYKTLNNKKLSTTIKDKIVSDCYRKSLLRLLGEPED